MVYPAANVHVSLKRCKQELPQYLILHYYEKNLSSQSQRMREGSYSTDQKEGIQEYDLIFEI